MVLLKGAASPDAHAPSADCLPLRPGTGQNPGCAGTSFFSTRPVAFHYC